MQLIHGDCLEELSVISDESIDCVLSDPPYGINYKSNKQKGDTRNGKEVKIREVSYFSEIIGDSQLPTDYIKILFNKLKPNSAIYLFCQWSKWSELESAVQNAGFTVKNMIVINKSNHGMGDIKGQYAPKHELLMFAVKGRHILDNSEIGRGKDVFDGKVLYSGAFRHHPNEKPTTWLEPFIHRSCPIGCIVLDPFMGSGSTGVACKNLNRNFIGIEKDETYFNIAKCRIENHLTNGEADGQETHGLPLR